MFQSLCQMHSSGQHLSSLTTNHLEEDLPEGCVGSPESIPVGVCVGNHSQKAFLLLLCLLLRLFDQSLPRCTLVVNAP